jgi:hypothetical protein
MEQRLPDTPGVSRDFWQNVFGVFSVSTTLCLTSFYSTRFRTRASQLGAVLGQHVHDSLVAMVIFDLSVFPMHECRRSLCQLSDFKLLRFSRNCVLIDHHGCSQRSLLLLLALRSYKSAVFSVDLGALSNGGGAGSADASRHVFMFREKLRYAARLGFGLWLVAFGVVFGTSFVIEPFDGHHRDTVFTVTAPILYAEFFLLFFPTIGFSYMAVSAIRWNHLPSSDRLIASFLAQTWFQFVRASRQYLRDVFGVGLDLFLPMFTGFATGVLVERERKSWKIVFGFLLFLSPVSLWESNGLLR